MQEIKDKVKNLVDRVELLKNALNLPQKKEKVMQLTEKSIDPDLWKDQYLARSVTQELSDIKKEIIQMEELTQTLEIMTQLAQDPKEAESLNIEIEKTEKTINELETVSFLSGDYDNKNAIVSIHAGQGGTEAMDWTNMLFRMYMRLCERRGWNTENLDTTPGEEAGLKSVIFKVSGRFAYGFLKAEAGTHRLVRQSPFNADKLRQTSFALVEVMPELEDVDLPDIKINEEDLDWQFVRSGGKGGQNVNKVSTAVRLTHIPSGLVVTASSERFQEQNRKIALNLLRGKLWLLEKEVAKGLKKELKGDYRPASWGTQIRSYVLHPYKMVKDLRTDVETGNTDAVLDGEIDEFLDAELKLLKLN